MNFTTAFEKLKSAMIADFNKFMDNERMRTEFANEIRIEEGRKYYKVMTRNSVWGFIVKTDKDVKFAIGDILKPASWKTPTRNSARGNVFGDYTINWTGPRYL